MVRLARLLTMLWFGVIPTATNNADEMYMTTEVGYSTVIDTTISTEELETSSIRSNHELSTRGTTTSATNKATNATATSKHLATSPTETEQSSTSKTSTRQSSTSKVSTSEETSSTHVTVYSTTSNRAPSNASPASTTQHATPKVFTSSPTSELSSRIYTPTNVTTIVGPDESGNTSAEITPTPSPSYEGESTKQRASFSSLVTRFSLSSETHSSTITSSVHDGKLTSQFESTADLSEHGATTSKGVDPWSEPNSANVFLLAVGAGGTIVVIIIVGCLYLGVRKARKRRFWGCGANGSGVAEIGMIFTKTQSKENGLNLEDTFEVDTGFNGASNNETEPKAKIKVQSGRDSTVVNQPLTTFTPGPDNFKRAQDRNLRDMLVQKNDEDDYYLGDGDYRDSVAL